MTKPKKNKVDGKITHYTRWATWERDVLSRVADPAGVQKLVAQRQLEIDDDATEMELVRGYFREKIAACNEDPNKASMFLPNPAAQVWLMEAIGEHMQTNKASTKLETLGIPELRACKHKDEDRHDRRGWRWKGTQSPRNATMTDYPYVVNLKERR